MNNVHTSILAVQANLSMGESLNGSNYQFTPTFYTTSAHHENHEFTSSDRDDNAFHFNPLGPVLQ